jgi:hypothetical protein
MKFCKHLFLSVCVQAVVEQLVGRVATTISNLDLNIVSVKSARAM